MGVRDLQKKFKLEKPWYSFSRNTITIATGLGYLLGDLLLDNTFYSILYSIKLIDSLLPCSYRITKFHCLVDFGPFHYAILCDAFISVPLGELYQHI